jgi:hypothetical protein
MSPPMPKHTPQPHHRTSATAANHAAAKSAITTKIERSSLGTPDARVMRARTSTAAARAVMARAAAIPHRASGKTTTSGGRARKTGHGSGG